MSLVSVALGLLHAHLCHDNIEGSRLASGQLLSWPCSCSPGSLALSLGLPVLVFQESPTAECGGHV